MVQGHEGVKAIVWLLLVGLRTLTGVSIITAFLIVAI